MNRPNINVTPLIDILLVLLIVFMVVTPLKPASFKTRVPSEPDRALNAPNDPKTLVVIVEPDGSIRLNNLIDLGSTNDTAPISKKLAEVFAERGANADVSQYFADDADRPAQDRIERAVFIKAPTKIDYGSVARVVDAVKFAGAYPISLQIDDLD